jgi:SAM-dependent methyltransferase
VFTKSARFYDALYSFKDYADAAQRVHKTIQEVRPGARRLLDVGCGTGKHLELLRRWYDVEGVDLCPELLEIARGRLPGVALYQQDMASLDIPGKFDLITCLFSAIAYVRTPERLRSTISAFARHLNPGGFAIIEPFFSPDRYWTHRLTLNIVDQPELKIAWMYTSGEPGEGTAVLDIHYLVGTPAGVEHFTESHEFGLFTADDYAVAFADAGFTARFDPLGFFGRGAYLATLSAVG